MIGKPDPERTEIVKAFAVLRRGVQASNHLLRMSNVFSPFQIALQLISWFGADVRAIILLSLQVSLTASVCAFAIGAPLGAAFAVYRFPGRNVLVVIANTLLGLPPVVVGLAVYVLLSRSGPLGSLGLLFHARRDGDRSGRVGHADRNRARPSDRGRALACIRR